MLKNIFICLLISIGTHGQNCSNAFWTIDNSGYIREWALNAGVISGGDQILNVYGTCMGISYAGNGSNTTFYCAMNNNTVKKIDFISGTEIIPFGIPVLNNGGYGADQYFMSGDNLVYYDGTTTTLVDSVPDFAVADIAVDSKGWAWVFEGSGASFETATSLRVYDKNGLLNSYPISFPSIGTYGSFFLNDTLYILKTAGVSVENPNTVIPVFINDNTAQLGTPISFFCAGCHDATSCNFQPLTTANTQTKENLTIYPNPTKGLISLNSDNSIDELHLYSIDGGFLKCIKKSNSLDLSEFPRGVYFLKIVTKNGIKTELIVKD